jgi:hypothetical protein
MRLRYTIRGLLRLTFFIAAGLAILLLLFKGIFSDPHPVRQIPFEPIA